MTMTGQTMNDPGFVRDAVRQFEGPLTRYAARLLGDADRARDVVQEAFLRLCAQDRAEVEPRLAEWLFTVCRNRSLDVLRKESRMTQLTDLQVGARTSPAPAPDEAAAHKEAAAKVVDLLDRLPQNQREVIRLKFQEGFSYKEISRISGHSVTNVGYLIHVGIKTLRGQLADGLAADARL
ncbi:sigma-70 family RNA polymerase sigma factor [Isosphaeraceae bacterium EP7]